MAWHQASQELTDRDKDWARNHFDATDSAMMQNPFSLYRYLRDEHPVTWSDAHGDGFWVISRYEDVKEVARDHRNFISSPGMAIPPLGNTRPMIPIETDPPAHRHYRLLVNDLFTPTAVAALEPQVTDATKHLIRGIVDSAARQSDLVRSLAYEQPMLVMWDEPFLGRPLPVDGHPEEEMPALLQSWVHDFKHDPHKTGAAAASMRAYVEDILRHRRRHPANDIPTRLLEAVIDGKPMSFDECADFMFILFSAGTATTGDALSGALLHLASHPNAATELRQADDTALRFATEEYIRFFGPAQAERRTAANDVNVKGVDIKEGQPVQMLWNSANRDERVFPNPDIVDLARDPNPHMAFGIGIHRCIGLHLARLQIRVAVREWLSQVEAFSVVDGFHVRWSVGLDRSLQELVVEW